MSRVQYKYVALKKKKYKAGFADVFPWTDLVSANFGRNLESLFSSIFCILVASEC